MPTDQVADLKQRTDNVSAYVAEAVARRIRYEHRVEELHRYEEEHGRFTREELAEAYAEIVGSAHDGKETAAA